jgi:hypothetical protein
VANRLFDELRLTVQSVGLVVVGIVVLGAGLMRVVQGRCTSFSADQDCVVFIGVSVVCFGLAYAFGATARHVRDEPPSAPGPEARCARCRRSYPTETMVRLSRLHSLPVLLSAFTDSTRTARYCRRCKHVMDACLVGLGLAGVAGIAYYLGWW